MAAMPSSIQKTHVLTALLLRTEELLCGEMSTHRILHMKSIFKWKIPPTYVLSQGLPVSCETYYLFSPTRRYISLSLAAAERGSDSPKAAGSQTKAFPSGVEHF